MNWVVYAGSQFLALEPFSNCAVIFIGNMKAKRPRKQQIPVEILSFNVGWACDALSMKSALVSEVRKFESKNACYLAVGYLSTVM